MGDCSIRAEGLSKAYRIGQRERYRTLRDGLAGVGATIKRAVTEPFRRTRSRYPLGTFSGAAQHGRESAGFVWALDDVSCEIKLGEVVGVIGPNGAGKTTLFKILSRITEPTKGQACVYGRVGSLLEVGTGFHPELTGRENIYLSGAILGMRRAEIERKFDEMVEFAGIETFLDTPVKRYSSGMYVRLAFAVAAHLEPEILLVDEVLAVGDAAFQQKCLGKMKQVAGSGRTVLFVSHNMSAVRNLCSRAMLVEGGRMVSDGPVETVVLEYLAKGSGLSEAGRMTFAQRLDRAGSGRVRLTFFEARAATGQGTAPRTGAETNFLIGYEARDTGAISSLQVIVTVSDGIGDSIFMCMPALTPLREFRSLSRSGTVLCKIHSLPLIPGRYSVSLSLKDEEGIADSIPYAACFEVVDGGESGLAVLPSGRWGKIVVPHEWGLAPAESLNCL